MRQRGASFWWKGSNGCERGCNINQFRNVPAINAHDISVVIGRVRRASSSNDELKGSCWLGAHRADIMSRNE